DQGRGGVLRNHQSGVDAGIGDEVVGQLARTGDELIGPALGDVSQFAKGDGEEVEGQRQRLAVKVSCRDDLVLFREDVRVVGHAVDLGQHNVGYVFNGIGAGTVDLRNTTEAIGVLNVALLLSDQVTSFQ